MNKIKNTHLTDLIKWNTDGKNGDNEYTSGVNIIAINNPQGDAAQLENVEWVEYLKKHIKWIFHWNQEYLQSLIKNIKVYLIYVKPIFF